MTDINKELKESLLAQLKKEFGENVTYSAMELYDIASPLIDKHLPKGSVVVKAVDKDKFVEQCVKEVNND